MIGMAYGRVDSTSYDDGNSNVFTCFIGHGGRGLHIARQLQNPPRISQSSVGTGYSSFGKDQSWFVDLYKLNSNYYGDWYSGFAYYSRNIGQSYRAVGFVEYTQPESSRLEPVTFSQISFQRKVMDESVNQLMVKWEF